MARPASSKPDSGSPSSDMLGFTTNLLSLRIRHSAFGIPSAFPGQPFYSTQIPVCLWFLAKNKAADAKRGFRGRVTGYKQILNQIL